MEKGHWYTDKNGNHYFVEDGQSPKEGWEQSKRRKMIDGGKYKIDDADGKGAREVSREEWEKYEADDDFDLTTDDDFGFDNDESDVIESEEDGEPTDEEGKTKGMYSKNGEWLGGFSKEYIMDHSNLTEEQAEKLADYYSDPDTTSGFDSPEDYLDRTSFEKEYKDVFEEGDEGAGYKPGDVPEGVDQNYKYTGQKIKLTHATGDVVNEEIATIIGLSFDDSWKEHYVWVREDETGHMHGYRVDDPENPFIRKIDERYNTKEIVEPLNSGKAAGGKQGPAKALKDWLGNTTDDEGNKIIDRISDGEDFSKPFTFHMDFENESKEKALERLNEKLAPYGVEATTSDPRSDKGWGEIVIRANGKKNPNGSEQKVPNANIPEGRMDNMGSQTGVNIERNDDGTLTISGNDGDIDQFMELYNNWLNKGKK